MPVCKDFVRCNVGGLSLQRFHLYDGIFLGRWYPKGLTAKRMVLVAVGWHKKTLMVFCREDSLVFCRFSLESKAHAFAFSTIIATERFFHLYQPATAPKPSKYSPSPPSFPSLLS